MESIINEIEKLASDIEGSPEPAQNLREKLITELKSGTATGSRVNESVASTAKQTTVTNKQQLHKEQESSKINQDLFYQGASENNS